MANRPRGFETLGDMIRSMALLVIPVLLVVGFLAINRDSPEQEAVDWRHALAQARAEAPYQVVAPEGLPEGDGYWVATRARWSPSDAEVPDDIGGNHWMVGFLDPSEIYIALHQSDTAERPMVVELSREGHADGEQQVNDQTWQRWVSEDDRTRTLVLPGEEVTTVVVGDTTYEALAAFASTLQEEGAA